MAIVVLESLKLEILEVGKSETHAVKFETLEAVKSETLEAVKFETLESVKSETLEVVAMELKLFWVGPSSPGKAVPEVDSQTQMVEVGGSGQAEALEFLERTRTAREEEMVSSHWM